MKTTELLLADFRQGYAIRFPLHSPAQQLHYQQFRTRLAQERESFSVAYDPHDRAVLVYPTKKESSS